MYDVLIIGGGAAGFYGAIHIAEARPELKVGILERGKQVLSKVKISGGGRCNVAHAEFEPRTLCSNYPRGEKELLGPFHHFGSGDTMEFFYKRGIALKIEEDGRIFPQSNTSQTIVDCFLNETKRLGIDLVRNRPVIDLHYDDALQRWEVITKYGSFTARRVLLATGSSQKIWHLLARLGHTIVTPVPSLFTFNIKDERLSGIQGISVRARIGILEKKRVSPGITMGLKSGQDQVVKMEAEGPLLITHWGMSGPSVLKLSAWGARLLHDYYYKFAIRVNWVPEYHPGAVLSMLNDIKEIEARKTVMRTQALEVPRRLWARLVLASGITSSQKWAEVTKTQLQSLKDQLTAAEFQVEGKSTFKEEFVTAGGVDLKEVDFRTFQSKRLPNLYFAGEIMDVDAITGGFNFQNAWTGAYLAARAIANAD